MTHLTALCPNNGQNVCRDCDAGFHLVGANCVLNVCVCSNTIENPTTGIDCSDHGQESCTQDHPDWKQAGDTSVYFKVLDYKMTLAQAHTDCQAAYPGSKLATILTQTEFDLIKSFEFESDARAWVDLTASGDIGERSNYYWGNGIAVNQKDDWWYDLGGSLGYGPWSHNSHMKKEAVFHEKIGLHNEPDPPIPAICELRF